MLITYREPEPTPPPKGHFTIELTEDEAVFLAGFIGDIPWCPDNLAEIYNAVDKQLVHENDWDDRALTSQTAYQDGRIAWKKSVRAAIEGPGSY